MDPTETETVTVETLETWDNRYRELVRLGVPNAGAALGAIGTSPWRMAHSPVVHEALSNAF